MPIRWARMRTAGPPILRRWFFTSRPIDLDPNFAMAYARLGVVYSNSGQASKGLDCTQQGL